jgi:hypothetical protein
VKVCDVLDYGLSAGVNGRWSNFTNLASQTEHSHFAAFASARNVYFAGGYVTSNLVLVLSRLCCLSSLTFVCIFQAVSSPIEWIFSDRITVTSPIFTITKREEIVLPLSFQAVAFLSVVVIRSRLTGSLCSSSRRFFVSYSLVHPFILFDSDVVDMYDYTSGSLFGVAHLSVARSHFCSKSSPFA